MADEQFLNQEQSQRKNDIIQQNQLNDEETISQHKCPNCGWGVTATADICENCSEWLLKGKCNFCYADIEEGQKFCSGCGNPPTGIICKSCGTLSHFDFCPNCNTPQTEQALEVIQELKNSIEFQNINNLLVSESQSGGETSANNLEQINNYLSKFNQQVKKKKSFSLETENNNIEENIKATEQSGAKVKSEQQKLIEQEQKEIEAIKLLKEAQSKKFANNQEARRFFGALKIILPEVIIKRKPIGWMCNAYGCTHSAPQECADPSMGGIWIYETSTEISTKEIAI
jgi:uncharacterized OB-fold protein